MASPSQDEYAPSQASSVSQEQLQVEPSTAVNSEQKLDRLDRLELALLLRDISTRLGAVESALSKTAKDQPNHRTQMLLDILRILLGGWPAFALLALIIFYSPLRTALNAIPAKVQSADEVTVGPISFKRTIKAEALRLGATDLSESIPKLSGPAIELLLRAVRKPNSEALISYTLDASGNYEKIYLPSESRIQSLDELEQAGLIEITGGTLDRFEPLNTKALRALLQDFRKNHPGHEEPSSDLERLTWIPNRPPEKRSVPVISWNLSERGTQAVNIILKAVSIELAPKASKTD
jgi:hypothetical protein